jgi:hypothetical protein
MSALISHERTNRTNTERLNISIARPRHRQPHLASASSISETNSSRRSTASGDETSAASNPVPRLVCPQRQGAGSSDVRAPAPESQFDEARRSYAIGTAVLDAVVPASAGRTPVVPGEARLLPTMSQAG